MADAIIVPEDREPSYLNKHLLTGAKVGLLAALGALAAIAVGAPAGAEALTVAETIAANSTLSILSALGIGTAIGAGSGIGCIRGKERIEKNKQEGRKVNPPGLFNEGMAQGVLNGALLGLAGIIITAVALGPILGTVAAGFVAASSLAFGFYQGNLHKEQMAVDYEQAKTKVADMQQGMFSQILEQVRGKDQPEMPKITSQDLEKLESRMRSSNGPKEGWVAKLADRRNPTLHEKDDGKDDKKAGDIDGVREWAEMVQDLEEDRLENNAAR